MSGEKKDAHGKVAWSEITALSKIIAEKGGHLGEEDIAKMMSLVDDLDEGTFPPGWKVPPRYLGDEGERQ